MVVHPGQPAPPGWVACERRPVDRVDAGLAGELHAAWLERIPLVLELAPGIGLDDPVVAPPERLTGRQPWEWQADLDLPAERLHHAVWANSLDGRDGGELRWRWREEACRAGAVPAGAGDAAGGSADLLADVVLPDGTRVLCDGGPLDSGLPALVGIPVLHRVSIEHGSLRPLAAERIAQAAVRGAARLAADQLAAVTAPGAGVRVIAPAGSGKTRVLTERARTLIADWGLPPAALALVAYNVRAAGEMRERLEDVPQLRIRTLNALGLRLCGRASTIDERTVRSLLGDLVAFPRRAETDPAAPWIEALSRVRLGLLAPEAVEDELGDVSDLDRVARAYRSALADRDAVDFDEQVAGAIERLLGDPAFRARSQRYARVLLVDEFQDLTPAHLLLIRLLSGPAGAVFAVGDDDQTIYGYAGATPRWLVDFTSWFPGSASHGLEVNYRCPPSVVHAASNLLTRNAVRVAKTIRAAPGRAGAAEADELDVVESGGRRPAGRTADRVQELLESGVSPAAVAVLSRVNASLVPVQVHLGHRGVPVDTSGDARFLQRGGVRGALAWLEVATAPASRLPGSALREAARRPKRGMSNSLLDLLARPRTAESLESLSIWLEGRGSAREAEKIDAFARDVALVGRAASRGTAAVLQVVRRQVGAGGLDATATALDQWSHGAIAAHLDDLDALVELAELEPDPQLFPGWLADQLSRGRKEGGVTLASIHAVKGREWPHVVLHHVSEGLLPHRLAVDVEEERRIFHVGLTRGSTTVSIVSGDKPSPFISELRQPGQPEPEGSKARSATNESGQRRSGRPAIAGTGRGQGSSRPRQSTAERPAELVAAAIGLEFTVGGQEHRVSELQEEGTLCLLTGGPARTAVRYGSTVTHGGRSVVLAHPASETAWEMLRAWRSDKAKELGVPAFVVFDDATLRLVAATLPVTEPTLLALRGVGPGKLDSYGSDLIAITESLRTST